MPLVSVLYGPLFARTNGYLLHTRSQNGIFLGVVTVDVKLEGLHQMFADEATAFDGYIFAVDRNNRFLSYPDKSSARNRIQANDPQT